MPITLPPIFEALGYPEPKQQRALLKLLQAAHAFGDVQGVDGVLTDPQADALLAHLTFNDYQQAVGLLHQITQEHVLAKEPEAYRNAAPELAQALADTGMLSEIKPVRKHYDHVLLLGAVESSTQDRFETMKRLWDQGVRFDKIHMLGSQRALGASEPSAAIAADEMAMMETHYYDPKSCWPKGLENVRIFEVNTFNKPCGARANTQDTIKAWLKTHPDAGEVLVISSQPSAQYQHAAVTSVLPDNFHVETVASAGKEVSISAAMDRFARQIDVGMPKLLEKLKAAPGVIKTPIIGIAPENIKVDAATYQFRSHGDANGVTDKGRYHADHWDPILHGDPIMLHERLDGSMHVADGHHRVELAKALNAKGTGPGNIMAMVLSEKQGYTARDAKIIAAYKNIAHGKTDVIETARVFREANSGQVHTEFLPSLQMDKGNLRMAFTMSKLSDKALDQVEREHIAPEIAAKLAELVPDDAPRQEAVMQIISQKLRQPYAQTSEAYATSLNVSMTALPKPGFVQKLAMQQASAVAFTR